MRVRVCVYACVTSVQEVVAKGIMVETDVIEEGETSRSASLQALCLYSI